MFQSTAERCFVGRLADYVIGEAFQPSLRLIWCADLGTRSISQLMQRRDLHVGRLKGLEKCRNVNCDVDT